MTSTVLLDLVNEGTSHALYIGTWCKTIHPPLRQQTSSRGNDAYEVFSVSRQLYESTFAYNIPAYNVTLTLRVSSRKFMQVMVKDADNISYS